MENTMTHALIPSDRVVGTAIYDRNGKHVGKIERLMIDKVTGQVQYGVVTFGGFLGFGEHYFPIPWDALKYHGPTDPLFAGTLNDGGYVLDVTEKQLEKAPYYGPNDDFDWGDRVNMDRVRQVHPAYGLD